MPKKKIVVQFGAGKYAPGEYGPPVRSGEFHLVYDPDKTLLPKYKKIKREVPNIFLRSKRAENTGLKSGVVHEVHIHNVFSDPQVKRLQDRELLLAEAARILRSDGAIYMGHTLTPEVIPQHELEQMAHRYGLNMQILVYNGPFQRRQKWDENESEVLHLIMGSGGTAVGAAAGAYLAKLTKKHD